MLPEAAQARKAIWDAVNPHTGIRRIDEAFPLELRESTRDHEMSIRFKSGSLWQVVGSDNFNSLIGSPPAGVIFSEWSIAKPSAWAYLRPILAENGGWALFIYTSRGHNHGYKLLKSAEKSGWFTQLLTVEETKAISDEVLENERQEYTREYGVDQGEALFMQEYFCDFNAPILGAYYGREMRKAEGRITKVAYDPEVPVHTAWDLGYTDDTAIWFYQVVRGEIHVLECHVSSGHPLEFYSALVKGKPYKYGFHYLPHDARAKTLASGGKSIEEQMWEQLGNKEVCIVPNLGIEDGIQAARRILPRCWFDEEKCADGLEALRQYQREWDEDKKVFRERPRHDWTSHAADAFRMLAVAWEKEPENKDGPKRDMLAKPTLDELWEFQPKASGRI